MQTKSLTNGVRRFGISAVAAMLAASMMLPGLAAADPSASELREQAQTEQQETENLKAQAEEAQQRADAAGDADELQSQAQEVLDKLNGMAETLDRTSAEYAEAIQAQQNAEERRDAAASKVKELQEQITEVQGDLSDRARSMYRSGVSDSVIDLLLGSSSFEELANNWDLLTRLNESDASLIQQAQDLQAEAEEQRQTYDREATTAAAKSEEAAAAKAEAESTAAAYQQEYDNLSSQAAEAVEAARAAQEAQEALQAQQVVQESAEQAATQAEQAEAAQRQADESSSDGDSGSSSAFDTGSGDSSNSGGSDISAAVSGSTVVSRAYSQLGKPYVWGATGPSSFDCSGLVGYALTGSYSRLGTTYTFMNWPQVSNPQPGDICTSWTHCGIYIGNGQMIHAPQTGDVVKVGPVQSGMKIVRYPG